MSVMAGVPARQLPTRRGHDLVGSSGFRVSGLEFRA